MLSWVNKCVAYNWFKHRSVCHKYVTSDGKGEKRIKERKEAREVRDSRQAEKWTVDKWWRLLWNSSSLYTLCYGFTPCLRAPDLMSDHMNNLSGRPIFSPLLVWGHPIRVPFMWKIQNFLCCYTFIWLVFAIVLKSEWTWTQPSTTVMKEHKFNNVLECFESIPIYDGRSIADDVPPHFDPMLSPLQLEDLQINMISFNICALIVLNDPPLGQCHNFIRDKTLLIWRKYAPSTKHGAHK